MSLDTQYAEFTVVATASRAGKPSVCSLTPEVPISVAFGAPLKNIATVYFGSGEKTSLEVSIDAVSKAVLAITARSVNILVSWPEFAIVDRVEGLPIVDSSLRVGESTSCNLDFDVATRDGEVVLFWDELGDCTAYSADAARILARDGKIIGLWVNDLTPKQTTLFRYHALKHRSREPASDDSSGEESTALLFRYLFVWDKKEGRVAASYYIDDIDGIDGAAASAAAPSDVSAGGLRESERAATTAALRLQYPETRYIFGGGFATSLERCVAAFFGMEKDFGSL